MSDLENMSEETITNDQPALVVETETEATVDTPHDDETELLEIVDEDEGDQDEKPKKPVTALDKSRYANEKKSKKTSIDCYPGTVNDCFESILYRTTWMSMKVYVRTSPTCQTLSLTIGETVR